jgi:hypothetical protein
MAALVSRLSPNGFHQFIDADDVQVWREAAEQPHHFDVAVSFMLKPPARLYAVEVAVDVKLQVNFRMVRWAANASRIDAFKAHPVQVEALDEGLNGANRIALFDPIIEAFRQQRSQAVVSLITPSRQLYP